MFFCLRFFLNKKPVRFFFNFCSGSCQYWVAIQLFFKYSECHFDIIMFYEGVCLILKAKDIFDE